MRAMILAAGLGTRMRPLTDRIPKPLFPVGGHPLIAWSFGLLKAAGITEIVINVHHLADQMEEAIAPYRALGLDIAFSREKDLLETGGGIAYARELLGDERFVAINADIVCDVDLGAVIEDHLQSGAIATMVVRENPDPAKVSVVEWDPASKRIFDIRREIGARTNWSRPTMFTGIHVIEPTVFDYLLPVRESIITGFYLPALRENRNIHGCFHEGFWADLGTAEEYYRVRDDITAISLAHARPLAAMVNAT